MYHFGSVPDWSIFSPRETSPEADKEDNLIAVSIQFEYDPDELATKMPHNWFKEGIVKPV